MGGRQAGPSRAIGRVETVRKCMPMFLDSGASAWENAAAGGLASREWLAARGNRLNATPTQGFVMEIRINSEGSANPTLEGPLQLGNLILVWPRLQAIRSLAFASPLEDLPQGPS